jgi:hypothetical protein
LFGPISNGSPAFFDLVFMLPVFRHPIVADEWKCSSTGEVMGHGAYPR